MFKKILFSFLCIFFAQAQADFKSYYYNPISRFYSTITQGIQKVKSFLGLQVVKQTLGNESSKRSVQKAKSAEIKHDGASNFKEHFFNYRFYKNREAELDGAVSNIQEIKSQSDLPLKNNQLFCEKCIPEDMKKTMQDAYGELIKGAAEIQNFLHTSILTLPQIPKTEFGIMRDQHIYLPQTEVFLHYYLAWDNMCKQFKVILHDIEKNKNLCDICKKSLYQEAKLVVETLYNQLHVIYNQMGDMKLYCIAPNVPTMIKEYQDSTIDFLKNYTVENKDYSHTLYEFLNIDKEKWIASSAQDLLKICNDKKLSDCQLEKKDLIEQIKFNLKTDIRKWLYDAYLMYHDDKNDAGFKKFYCASDTSAAYMVVNIFDQSDAFKTVLTPILQLINTHIKNLTKF